jgi:hypothetical protein
MYSQFQVQILGDMFKDKQSCNFAQAYFRETVYMKSVK